MGRDAAVGEIGVDSAVLELDPHAQRMREKQTAKRRTCMRFKNASYYEDRIQILFYALHL